MASFAKRKVIGDLTFADLRAQPLRLIDAIIAADPETMIAFRKRVRDWGGDREAVRELLDALFDLMSLHAEGREADDSFLDRFADAMARAEAPSRPVIERASGGYAIKRVAPAEASGERFWALWWAVLKPLVDLVLREADRIGACEWCDKLFITTRAGHQYCCDVCRATASRHRRRGRVPPTP